jgi:LAS superfamily LD-carboxypeptidase LdcB
MNKLHFKFKPEHKPLYIGFAIVAIVFIATGTYAYMRMDTLSTRLNGLSESITTLQSELASTSADLKTTIERTHTTLSSAINAEQQNVGAIKQQLGGFQNQVGNLSGTVSSIQKLSQIDPELLKKYSKVYFLNENYVPAHLSEIPLSYQYSDHKQLLYETEALPKLEHMIDVASSSGVQIYVFSAYRSFAEQKALKGIYTMEYGAGTANSFSADQGYSEHQLGTAVDLITPGQGGQLEDTFDQTKAYQWLVANAYKYGFELSYPKSNDYYVYEPWHWRYVGVKLATYLHDNHLNFYDVDQRTIDTYLINIWD